MNKLTPVVEKGLTVIIYKRLLTRYIHFAIIVFRSIFFRKWQLQPRQQRMTGEAPVEIFADGDSDVSNFTAKVIGKRKAALRSLRRRKMLRKTKVSLRTMAASRWVYFTLVGKRLNK